MRDNERQRTSLAVSSHAPGTSVRFRACAPEFMSRHKTGAISFPALYSGKNFSLVVFDAIATGFNWPKLSQLSVVCSSC